MSYQKQFSNRKNIYYGFFVTLFAALFFSFNSEKTQYLNKKAVFNSKNEFAKLKYRVDGINNLQCVRMGKDTVDKYLESMNFLSKKDRIILKLTSKNITIPDPTFTVYSYLARNQKKHATGVTPETLPIIDNCSVPLDPNKEHILGNNYLPLKKLKKYIDNLDLTNSDYTYLKFTPYVTATGHIIFKISAYGSNNNLITLKSNMLFGADETNPSPPADPSDDQ